MTILQAKQDKSVPIFGDGSGIRNWLHVDDYSVAVDKIIHHGSPGEIYNVSSAETWNNLDLVKYILSKMNKPQDLYHFLPDKKQREEGCLLNSEKIESTLGWKPGINIDQGLDLTIQWYLTQEQWLEEIKSGEYTNYYRKIYYEES